MTESRAHIANGLIVLVLIAGSLLAYGDVPSEIPRHFGITGDVDGWWPKNWLTWSVAPAVGIILGVGLYAVAGFLQRRARTINVPNQEQFDALTEEQKIEVAAIAQRYLYWTAFGVLILFSSIQFSVYEIAMGHSQSFPSYVVLLTVLVILSMVGGALWVGIASTRRISKLHRAQHENAPSEQRVPDDETG